MPPPPLPTLISLNPTLAELFISIFRHLKLLIAGAKNSFKWRKIYLLVDNRHLSNLLIALIETTLEW